MSKRVEAAFERLQEMGFERQWSVDVRDVFVRRATLMFHPSGATALVMVFGRDEQEGFDIYFPAAESNNIDETFAAVEARVQQTTEAQGG